MGHQNKKSLVKQAEEVLTGKLQIGESKNEAKHLGVACDGIYSWSTYKGYLSICCRFLTDCKEQHGCKTLSEARQYANEWLHKYDDSPYTQKTYMAALCKLYGEHSENFFHTKDRERKDIHRSRNDVVRDTHFSERNNKELVTFCKSTGLRRKELENIRGHQLKVTANGYYIHVKGKGGRWRDALVCGTDKEIQLVVHKMKSAGKEKVWGKVHSNADIHSYRRIYCTRVYTLFARPIETLSHSEKFFCRKDKKGIVYDRKAMRIASNNLGHNRISVIAGHYL